MYLQQTWTAADFEAVGADKDSCQRPDGRSRQNVLAWTAVNIWTAADFEAVGADNDSCCSRPTWISENCALRDR
jgi:hypothetical protein